MHLCEGALIGLALLQVYGLLDMHEHLEVVLPRVCSLLATPGTESLLQVGALLCPPICLPYWLAACKLMHSPGGRQCLTES